MDLTGKVIVITGAAKGLGRAMATRMASRTPHLALIDMNEDALAETQALCEQAGATVSGWICDIASEDQIDETFPQIAAAQGRLDVLVNNAGITSDSSLIKVENGVVKKRMSLEHWQRVIDINLTGTFLCGRAAATEMVKTGQGGCIINISSISRHGNVGQTNYSATKAGVAAMSVTWAKELANHGIRCAAIAPGFIETEMVLSMKSKVLEKIAASIPIQRLGNPDEIAQAVEFIIENDYINGRVMEIDGGLRI